MLFCLPFFYSDEGGEKKVQFFSDFSSLNPLNFQKRSRSLIMGKIIGVGSALTVVFLGHTLNLNAKVKSKQNR
jgi:hypothetical protein